MGSIFTRRLRLEAEALAASVRTALRREYAEHGATLRMRRLGQRLWALRELVLHLDDWDAGLVGRPEILAAVARSRAAVPEIDDPESSDFAEEAEALAARIERLAAPCVSMGAFAPMFVPHLVERDA